MALGVFPAGDWLQVQSIFRLGLELDRSQNVGVASERRSGHRWVRDAVMTGQQHTQPAAHVIHYIACRDVLSTTGSIDGVHRDPACPVALWCKSYDCPDALLARSRPLRVLVKVQHNSRRGTPMTRCDMVIDRVFENSTEQANLVLHYVAGTHIPFRALPFILTKTAFNARLSDLFEQASRFPFVGAFQEERLLYIDCCFAL